MPVAIKGNAAGNAGYWGIHTMKDRSNTREEDGPNDRVTVIEIRGLLAENVPDALREMELIAKQSRCHGDFMYAASINPHSDQPLTPKQWDRAVDLLEEKLGLQGHQRIIVEHEKNGRVHRHPLWNRVDVDTLKVTDIKGNWFSHQRVSRQLEQEFGLVPMPSLHGERRPEGRPDRTPELWEYRAAERTGIDPKELKAGLTALWHETDNGKAFVAGLEEKGIILAVGDRRSFVIVDSAGTPHSLPKRIDGVNTAQVRERLSDIELSSLPTVSEAQATQRGRETLSRDEPMPSQVNTVDLVGTGKAGAAPLTAEEQFIKFRDEAEARNKAEADAHRATLAGAAPLTAKEQFIKFRDEAEARNKAEADAHRATLAGAAPLTAEEQFIKFRDEAEARNKAEADAHRATLAGAAPLTAEEQFIKFRDEAEARNKAEADAHRATLAGAAPLTAEEQFIKFRDEAEARNKAEADAHRATLAGAAPLTAEEQFIKTRAEAEAVNQAEADARRNEINWEFRKAAGDPWKRQGGSERAQAKTQELWSKGTAEGVAHVTTPPSQVEHVAETTGFKVAGFAGGLADFASSLLAGGSKEPPKTPSQVEQIKEQRRALVALERLHDSMDRGEAFQPSDIRSLTPTHLEQLRLFGDGYMRKLLESFDYQRQEQERDDDRGRSLGR